MIHRTIDRVGVGTGNNRNRIGIVMPHANQYTVGEQVMVMTREELDAQIAAAPGFDPTEVWDLSTSIWRVIGMHPDIHTSTPMWWCGFRSGTHGNDWCREKGIANSQRATTIVEALKLMLAAVKGANCPCRSLTDDQYGYAKQTGFPSEFNTSPPNNWRFTDGASAKYLFAMPGDDCPLSCGRQLPPAPEPKVCTCETAEWDNADGTWHVDHGSYNAYYEVGEACNECGRVFTLKPAASMTIEECSVECKRIKNAQGTLSCGAETEGFRVYWHTWDEEPDLAVTMTNPDSGYRPTCLEAWQLATTHLQAEEATGNTT